MDFFTKYRDRFRLTAIVSSLYFNFALIFAAWTGEFAAWFTAFFIASVAIISAFVCFLVPEPDHEESIDSSEVAETIHGSFI